VKTAAEIIEYLESQAAMEETDADAWAATVRSIPASAIGPVFLHEVHTHRYASMILLAVAKVIRKDAKIP
jgi:hypothetical protein